MPESCVCAIESNELTESSDTMSPYEQATHWRRRHPDLAWAGRAAEAPRA